MYETIFKIVARNEKDEEISTHLYTDYETAVSDAREMAESRNVAYFTQIISHETQPATIVHHFDDDKTITVYESGWAEDVNGKIRLCTEVDYTGKAQFIFLEDEKSFKEYLN